MLPPFGFFWHGFERKRNHNILILMVDSRFKGMHWSRAMWDRKMWLNWLLLMMNNY
jgi:hypothetical protein